MTVRVAGSLLWLAAAAAGQAMRVDGEARRYTLPVLGAARVGVELDGNLRWSAEAARARWEGGAGEGRWVLEFERPRLEWVLRFSKSADGRGIRVTSRLRNTGAAAVRLGRVILGDWAGAAVGEDAVALVMSGWQTPSVVKRVRAGELVSKTLTVLHSRGSGVSALVGFTSFDRANTEIGMRWDARWSGVSVTAYCDFEGFLLSAGTEVDSERLLVRVDADPLALLESWADEARARYQPRIWPKIPAGWVGWSWVDPFHVERYEDVVRRNAQAIRQRLAGFDIEYLWVSLGNLEDRQPGNWLRWNRELFPSGPEALVRDLGRLDFKLGLWMGAFWLSPRLSAEVERLRGAFLMKDGRPLTVPHRELGSVFILDPTHPATHAWLREALGQYRAWGVRYYMIDFLYSISGSTPGAFRPSGFYNRALVAGPETYREGLKVVREAAGEDTYLLASTGPTLQSVGLVDGVRTGSDYGEGRPLDGPGKGFYPGTFVINKPDFWTSHRRATESLASHFYMHRKLFLADSGNVLTVDQPAPWNEAEISATLFGINGGPLMLGDDIARMSEERLRLVRQVLPRLPEAAAPLDLFESPEPDYPKLFHLKVRTGWDGWDLVALFNYGGETLRRTVALERLGLAEDAASVVWDFWRERYLGACQRELAVEVPGCSVRLLRVSRRRDHPWLLSTDMHVRQGQAEIGEVRWDAGRMELTLAARRPPGSRGSAFLLAPKGFALKAPAGLLIAKDGGEGTLVVRVPLEFGASGEQRRVIRFTRFQP